MNETIKGINLKDLLNNEEVVTVDSIFLPKLGKCFLGNGTIILNHSKPVIAWDEFQVLKSHRKDEKGAKYDLEGGRIEVDFSNMTINATYHAAWIGGLVETESIESSFEVTIKESYQQGMDKEYDKPLYFLTLVSK